MGRLWWLTAEIEFVVWQDENDTIYAELKVIEANVSWITYNFKIENAQLIGELESKMTLK